MLQEPSTCLAAMTRCGLSEAYCCENEKVILLVHRKAGGLEPAFGSESDSHQLSTRVTPWGIWSWSIGEANHGWRAAMSRQGFWENVQLQSCSQWLGSKITCFRSPAMMIGWCVDLRSISAWHSCIWSHDCCLWFMIIWLFFCYYYACGMFVSEIVGLHHPLALSMTLTVVS